MKTVLGFDTSNYTTSAAVFRADGTGCNEGRLLDVPEGGLGLRQSDALFQHVRRLPERVDALLGAGNCPRCQNWPPSELPPPPGSGRLPICHVSSPERLRPGCWRTCWGCLFRLLPPAGPCGCRQLERRSPRTSGRALPVLAPVRRHDGAPAHRAGGRNAPYDHFGGRRRTSRPVSSLTAPESCLASRSRRVRRWMHWRPRATAQMASRSSSGNSAFPSRGWKIR